jgi:hypothetical protein
MTSLYKWILSASDMMCNTWDYCVFWNLSIVLYSKKHFLGTGSVTVVS